MQSRVYAEHTVLHKVIAERPEAFLRAAAEAGEGVGLPPFVQREFREFWNRCQAWPIPMDFDKCPTAAASSHLSRFRPASSTGPDGERVQKTTSRTA